MERTVRERERERERKRKQNKTRTSLTQQQVGQQEVAEVVGRHGQFETISCHLSLSRANDTRVVDL